MASRSDGAPAPSRPVRAPRLAAAAIAGMLLALLAPASAAHAAPAQPQIDTFGLSPYADGFGTTSETLLVEVRIPDWGEAGGGFTRITVEDGSGEVVDSCEAESDSLDSQACEVSFAMGENRITAVAIDWSESESASPASEPVIVYRGGSDQPVITEPVSGADAHGPFTVAGAGPALGQIVVAIVDLSTGEEEIDPVEVCTATVSILGAWSCLAEVPVSIATLVAFSTAVDGGQGSSETVEVYSYPPQAEADYTFGPASVSAVMTGIEGSNVYVQFYAAVLNEAGYFDFELVTTCPADAGGGPASDGGITAAAQVQDCSVSDLQPGVWNPYTAVEYVDGEGVSFTTWRDDYILIPDAPTISGASAGRTVTLSGHAEGEVRVSARAAGGEEVCSSAPEPTGAWSCSFEAEPGTGSYFAVAQSEGWEVDREQIPLQFEPEYGASYDGISPASGAVSVTVAAPPPPPAEPPAAPPAEPAAPPAAPPTGPAPASFEWSFEVTGGGASGFLPGSAITIIGRGAPADAQVIAELHSDPVSLGAATADEAGGFRITGFIPEEVEPGEHEVVVTVQAAGYEPASRAIPTAVALPAPDPVATEPQPEQSEEPEAPAGGGGPGAAGGERGEPASPNVLSDALATVATVVGNPGAIAGAAGLALALLFLVAIPTELLTSTLSANAARLGPVVGLVRRGGGRLRERLAGRTGAQAVAAVGLALATSLVLGFADPGFGFDLASLRLVLALGLAYFLLTYVVGRVVGAIVRRAWGVSTGIEIQPVILVFAALGVLVSRLLGFAPGILIGVAIGLELLQEHRRAALGAALLSFGSVLALSLGAWIGYSALTAGGDPAGFGGALLADTLSAVTVEGLTAALVAILPLAFLEGRTLWKASKPLWAGSFILIGTAFALLVLPTALADTDPAEIAFWYLVLLVYGAIAFAVWGVFAWRARREDRDAALQDEARR